METELILRLTLIIFRVLLTYYGDQYEADNPPFLFFTEGEHIVLTGEFKGVNEIILCDNELINKCSYQNKQKIILHGQTQMLIEISIYPWTYGDRIWIHASPNKKGHRFIIGQIYDRVTPIEKGGY